MSAEPRWRRLEPDERREQILAAAIRAFGEQRYQAVQMAEVARVAGVARGLVHHYFGTKRDLYLEVVRTMMFVPPLEDVHLPGGELRDRVAATVDWLLTVLAEHGRTGVAVGVEGPGADDDIRAILDEADDQAAVRLLDVVGFAGGPAERAVALAAVRAYGGTVKAAGREWIVRGALDREQVRELLTHTFLALVEDVFPRVLPQRPGTVPGSATEGAPGSATEGAPDGVTGG